MILKSLFLTDAMENLKRRAWIFWGSFLLFFCCYPGFLLLILNNIKSRYSASDRLEEQMVFMKSYVTNLYEENIFVTCLVIGLGILFGIQGYAYLHHKRQVNFYHSQPVKRSRRFWVLWANGVFLFLVAYLVNFTLGLVVIAGYGCFSLAVVAMGIKAFAFYLTLFLSMYHIAMIAVMLTGHTLVSILATGVLLGYEIAVRGMILLYRDTFFITHSYRGGTIDCITSPLMKVFGYFQYRNSSYPWTKELFPYGEILIHLTMLSIVYGILAFLLYEKRPMEGYGRNISFKIIKEPLRVALLSLFGVSGALLFYEMAGRSMVFGMAGAAFSVFLGQVVIQMIYEVDLRAVRKNLSSVAIALVFTFSFFLFFRYDPMYMDGKLPGRFMVEAVGIELPGVSSRDNNWVMENGREIWGLQYSREMMRLTDLDLVYEALGQAVEPKEFRKAIGQEEQQENYFGMEVSFHKKNGKKEDRVLYFREKQIGQIFHSIYELEEYQKVVNQTTTENFLEKYRITAAEYSNGIDSVRLEEELLVALHTAYQKDLKEVSYEKIYLQPPVGHLVFEGIGLQSEEYINRWRVLIFSEFENTIALLEQQKIDWKAEFSGEFLEQVECIQVSCTDYEAWSYSVDKTKDAYTKTIIYQDKEELQNLLRDAVPGDNIYWSTGPNIDYSDSAGLEIQVVRTLKGEERKEFFGEDYSGDGRSVIVVVYRKEELPATIKEDLEKVSYGETITK